MTARRRQNAAHGIEQTGAKLRAMMPWIQANKIVDKEKTNFLFYCFKRTLLNAGFLFY